ncbi:hypothetical protein BDF22DRAFT_652567 [Syncephalis plumigaleata]|nr:hypothetical protein BDF22DRAFT_652567 [Syncephalis plumigaleata]
MSLELSHRFYGTANPDSTLSEAGMRRYKLRAIPLSHLVDKSFADGSASNDDPVAESSTSTDVKRVNKQDKSSAIPLWQQIADDVYRETAPGSAGVNNGKQRRKRSRYDGPGLVDIHKAKKTSHQRIMEKFSDRNMRKVAEDSIVYRQRMRDRDRKISHW